MKKEIIKKSLLYSLPLLLFTGLVVLGVLALTSAPPEKTAQTQNETKPVPAFNVDGLRATDLPQDKAALVTFFASWCVPCEAEHPYIFALSADHPVYGLAFLDKPEKTQEFLERLGNPYQKVGHDTNGIAAAEWGIIGVPTSFVIKSGQILMRHDGPLTEEIIAQKIRPLMDKDETQ